MKQVYPNSIESGIQVVFNGATWVCIGLGMDWVNPIGYQLGFSWYYLQNILGIQSMVPLWYTLGQVKL